MPQVVILEVLLLPRSEGVVLVREVVPLFLEKFDWIFQRVVIHQAVEDLRPDASVEVARNRQSAH